MTEEAITRFSDLALAAPILKAVAEVGYETPSPIQARTIPPLLAGRDLLGVAQTGTGKTAAFALPLLSRLDLAQRRPQLLVLTPTRELAIQVAEAMQAYARHLPGFHVLPVYGGQGMGTQLRQLERGVHVVVGTPGRVQDHLRRATLVLDHLAAVVLDEADEMLRMGFIDDVEEILRRAPEGRQVALFSATMPEPIRRVARTHLHDPVEVRIEAKTSTVKTIRQRYWQVSGTHKLDALTRILEVEDFNGLLIFVRTKVATEELAEKLEARGYACAALNGDMNQALREKTVERLKGGALDIVVATDVAARGLDVERISHVVNYDIPYDTEAYVHRIGRTGRAGRKGEAILFVAPRERRMLAAIERATGQKIAPMQLPTRADITGRRIEQFKQSITDTIEGQELGFFEELVEAYQGERNTGLAEIAAALAFLVQRERPLLEDLPEEAPARPAPPPRARPVEPVRGRQRPERRPEAREHERPAPERARTSARTGADAAAPRPAPVSVPNAAPRREPGGVAAPREKTPPVREPAPREPKPSGRARAEDPRLADPAVRAKRPGKGEARAEPGTVRYRLEVGRAHGAEPKHIVGAIANEAGLESRYIGRLTIHEDHSTVDLPEGMPKDIFRHLRKVWVCGRQLQLSTLGAEAPAAPEAKPRDRLRLKSPAPRAAKPGGGKPKPRKPFKSKRP